MGRVGSGVTGVGGKGKVTTGAGEYTEAQSQTLGTRPGNNNNKKGNGNVQGWECPKSAQMNGEHPAKQEGNVSGF